jgi:hypothetical protein
VLQLELPKGANRYLAGAKNGIGLIKQLFLLILDLILVYVKLLGKFRQRLVAFNRGQRCLCFEPRQMVSSFASHLLLLWWLKLPQELLQVGEDR